jgi:hypothetical protein
MKRIRDNSISQGDYDKVKMVIFGSADAIITSMDVDDEEVEKNLSEYLYALSKDY